MPKKIRELKQMLKKAGFSLEPGKGSHTNWTHSKLPGKKVTVSGQDGSDAKKYQEKQVKDAIREVEEQE
jgi:predicted RNA binding protein YcfA (HicA-like mRNA interferase family)